MNVEACDDCKQLNLKSPLFRLAETGPESLAVGFGVHCADSKLEVMRPYKTLCSHCLCSRIDNLLGTMGALGAAVQPQQDQH